MALEQDNVIDGIRFQMDLEGIGAANMHGFFVDWPNPPLPERHLDILKASHGIEIAVDTATGHVVGFINAISDGCFSSYIPLLEVLPEYQGRGIARELVRRLVARYADLYMLDLCCNEDIVPVYASHGFLQVSGMVHRNFDRQSAEGTDIPS